RPAAAIRLARLGPRNPALRVDRATGDERRCDQPFSIRRIARAPTLPQPGDARRRVAGATLIVAVPRRPDRGPRGEGVGEGRHGPEATLRRGDLDPIAGPRAREGRSDFQGASVSVIERGGALDTP